MIAQHADIERGLEGFPSQVLRRCTITHRLENLDFQARAGEIRYVAWARAIGEIVIGHDLQALPAALANPFERFAMTTGVAQSLGDRHRVALLHRFRADLRGGFYVDVSSTQELLSDPNELTKEQAEECLTYAKSAITKLLK
jgi:hypothetical protein